MTARRHRPIVARDRVTPGVNVTIQIWDASTPALERAARAGRGRLLHTSAGHNRVPTTGLNRIVSMLANDGTDGLTRFALGTSATATANGDTALGAEVLNAAITRIVQTTGTLTAQFFLATTQLNGTTIREAGLFTADDVLYARYVLAPAIAKTSAIAVTFTWVHIFSWTP